MTFPELVNQKLSHGKYGLYRWLVNNSQYIMTLIEPGANESHEMLKSISEARSFIIHGINFDAENAKKARALDIPISLPFKKCFIEGPAMKVINRSNTIYLGSHLEELGPNLIQHICIYAHLEKEGVRLETFIVNVSPFDWNSQFNTIPEATLAVFMYALNNKKEFVSGKATAKERSYSGREKVSDYIFVRKAAVSEIEKKHNVNINWKHHWEVIGHWRKLDGIGKDRDGIYGVNGFTWVSSYTKGAKDMPLVKKTRIIQSQSLLQ